MTVAMSVDRPLEAAITRQQGGAMGILSETEKERLMRIPTSIEEAQQILERNQQLLEKLNEAVRYNSYASASVPIGCPHCRREGISCAPCAWNVGVAGRHEPRLMACCFPTFGGVAYVDQTLVKYGVNIAWIEGKPNSIQAECARLFLEGHIEWAMMVIAAGGVPWPEGACAWPEGTLED
jgi:hypothetical protein